MHSESTGFHRAIRNAPLAIVAAFLALASLWIIKGDASKIDWMGRGTETTKDSIRPALPFARGMPLEAAQHAAGVQSVLQRADTLSSGASLELHRWQLPDGYEATAVFENGRMMEWHLMYVVPGASIGQDYDLYRRYAEEPTSVPPGETLETNANNAEFVQLPDFYPGNITPPPTRSQAGGQVTWPISPRSPEEIAAERAQMGARYYADQQAQSRARAAARNAPVRSDVNQPVIVSPRVEVPAIQVPRIVSGP